MFTADLPAPENLVPRLHFADTDFRNRNWDMTIMQE